MMASVAIVSPPARDREPVLVLLFVAAVSPLFGTSCCVVKDNLGVIGRSLRRGDAPFPRAATLKSDLILVVIALRVQ